MLFFPLNRRIEKPRRMRGRRLFAGPCRAGRGGAEAGGDRRRRGKRACAREARSVCRARRKGGGPAEVHRRSHSPAAQRRDSRGDRGVPQEVVSLAAGGGGKSPQGQAERRAGEGGRPLQVDRPANAPAHRRPGGEKEACRVSRRVAEGRLQRTDSRRAHRPVARPPGRSRRGAESR